MGISPMAQIQLMDGHGPQPNRLRIRLVSTAASVELQRVLRSEMLRVCPKVYGHEVPQVVPQFVS